MNNKLLINMNIILIKIILRKSILVYYLDFYLDLLNFRKQ